MQMKMPFLETTKTPEKAPPTSSAAASPKREWDQIDSKAKAEALGVLARIIARMLAATAKEARHD